MPVPKTAIDEGQIEGAVVEILTSKQLKRRDVHYEIVVFPSQDQARVKVWKKGNPFGFVGEKLIDLHCDGVFT